MRSIPLVLLLAGAAHALEGEPALSLAVPDATLRAVGDRPVTVYLRNGAQLGARIVAFEPSTVTVALLLSGTVVTLDRQLVTEVRLPPARVAAPVEPAAPGPERERHFAAQLSLAPGLSLDVDYKLFYGFANFSIVMPAATGGRIVGMSLGLGVSFRVAKSSRWKLDLFGFVAPMRLAIDNAEDYPNENAWSVGIGIGIGMHYTFSSGFALGFKLPVVGYATNGGSSGMLAFYLSSAVGLPILSMGYRF